MKVTIVFDSLYGNTKKIAEAIAAGFAKSDQIKLISASLAKPNDCAQTDLIIVGSPVHGGQPSQATQDFLQNLPSLKGIKVTAFDTRMSEKDQNLLLQLLMKVIQYAAPRISSALVAKGGSLVAHPQGFIVNDKQGPIKIGELERAGAWGQQLSKS